MTIPVPSTPTQSPHHQTQNQNLRRRPHASHNTPGRSSAVIGDGSGSKTRILLALAIACLWPLVFIVLSVIFADATASGTNNNAAAAAGQSDSTNQEIMNPGLSFRKYLDRVDIMGYGPTHPRVAVVIVGSVVPTTTNGQQQNVSSNIISTVESVFSNTDLNRLFVVCVAVDGAASDSKLVKRLTAIDQGAGPHWHGLRPDIHTSSGGAKSNKDSSNLHEEEPHGKKIHVLFSKVKQGTAASRSDAVEFISLLSKKHERAGIKSPEEDLILLIMQAGAELTSRKWLSPITSALIVPPPLMGDYDPQVALKIANAVSFGVEHVGENKAVAFDYSLKPTWVTPSAKDMALSNGDSYPTPALAGLATAMRLATFQQLPAQDLSLTDDWAANLDLALNLWLCADGIDVLKDVTVKSSSSTAGSDFLASTGMTMLEPKDAARFAAAWMDLKYATRVFNAIKTTHPQLTQLEWDTMLAQAKGRPDFPAGLQNKCRSFAWYATEVHTELNMDDEIANPKGLPSSAISPERKAEEAKQKVEVHLPDAPLQIPKVEEEGQDKLPPPPGQGKKEPDPKEVGKEGKKPSKPLDPARLAIIQKAHPVDTTFVDVSLGHANFPHKGARDEHGNWGYVHDETALRRNPPKFEYPGLKDACDKQDDTYKMLTEQVFVDFKANDEAEKSGKASAKIFCFVYTIDSGHDRIPFIRETWGPKCDGFMAASNKTDASIGAVDIPHEGLEEYDNIWQKVRSMWSYVYDNYYEKYDWFHIGGDDLYLIIENLRLYLESEEILTAQNGGIYLPSGDEKTQTPLFLGRRFKYLGDPNDIFNSGGSGYTMNKAALKLLVVDGFPNYFPHLKTFSEDTMVARILRKMGVYPYDTKDEEGGERYNPFEPGHHWRYRPPADISKDWYAKYSIDVKWGKEHCAKRSVAFHYIKKEAHKRLFALLYHLCPK